MTENIGRFDTDVVIDGEDRVAARFPFLHAQMIFRKKSMQGIPRGILAR
jgi:hypothetical protein